MFLPELFLWSLIMPHQTQSFFCIHSEPFLRVERKKKRFNQKYLLEGKIENISKARETTFTMQPDSGTTLCQLSHVSPQDITSHFIHWVI